MAVNSGIFSDPNAVIGRALRAMRRPTVPDRDALYRDYSADRDVYNRVWRPTPYEPREAEVERVAQDLGIDTDTARSLIREAARIEGGGIDIMEHMQPNLQYANFIGLLQNHQQHLAPFVERQVTALTQPQAPVNRSIRTAPEIDERDLAREEQAAARAVNAQDFGRMRGEEQMQKEALANEMAAQLAQDMQQMTPESARAAMQDIAAAEEAANAQAAASRVAAELTLAAQEEEQQAIEAAINRARVEPVAPPQPPQQYTPVQVPHRAIAKELNNRQQPVAPPVNVISVTPNNIAAAVANYNMARAEESEAAARAAMETRAEQAAQLEQDLQSVEEAAIPGPISLGQLTEAIALAEREAEMAAQLETDLQGILGADMKGAQQQEARAIAAQEIAAAMTQNEMGMGMRSGPTPGSFRAAQEEALGFTVPAPVAATRPYQEPNMPAPVSPEAVAAAVAQAQAIAASQEMDDTPPSYQNEMETAAEAAQAQAARDVAAAAEAARETARQAAAAELAEEQAAQLAQDLQGIPGIGLQNEAPTAGFGYGSQNEAPTAGFGYGSQNEAPTAGFGYGSQNEAPTAGFGYGSQNEAPAPANFGNLGNLPAAVEAARQNEMESLNEAQQPAEFGVPGPGPGLGSIGDPVSELEQAVAKPQETEATIVDVTGKRTGIGRLTGPVQTIVVHDEAPDSNQKAKSVSVDRTEGDNIKSYHITFDDKGVYIHVPLNRMAPHAMAFNDKSISVARRGALYNPGVRTRDVGPKGKPDQVKPLTPAERRNAAIALGIAMRATGLGPDAIRTHSELGPTGTATSRSVDEGHWRAEALAELEKNKAAIEPILKNNPVAQRAQNDFATRKEPPKPRNAPPTRDELRERTRSILPPSPQQRSSLDALQQLFADLNPLGVPSAQGAGMSSAFQGVEAEADGEQFQPVAPPVVFAPPPVAAPVAETPAVTSSLGDLSQQSSSFSNDPVASGTLGGSASLSSQSPAAGGSGGSGRSDAGRGGSNSGGGMAATGTTTGDVGAPAAVSSLGIGDSLGGPTGTGKGGGGENQPGPETGLTGPGTGETAMTGNEVGSRSPTSVDLGVSRAEVAAQIAADVEAGRLSPEEAAALSAMLGPSPLGPMSSFTGIGPATTLGDEAAAQAAQAASRAGPTPGSFRGAQEVGMQGSFRSAQEVGMQALETGLAALSSSFGNQPSTGSYGVQSEDTTEADPDGGLPGGQTAAQAMAEQAATLGSLGNEQDGPGTTDPSTGSTTGETSPGGGGDGNTPGTETANYGEMGFGVFGGDGGQSNDTSGTGGGTGGYGGYGGYGGGGYDSGDGSDHGGGGYGEGQGPGGPADSGMGGYGGTGNTGAGSSPADGASTSGGPMADGGRVSAPKQYKAIVERALRAARRSRAA